MNAAQTQVECKTEGNCQNLVHNDYEVKTHQTNQRARLEHSKVSHHRGRWWPHEVGNNLKQKQRAR